MEIILSIIILVLICALLWCGRQLLDAERTRQTEREDLIERRIDDRVKLTKEFESERQKLMDKLLIRSGASPIYAEREPPKPHVVESQLDRNARLKREKEGGHRIEVKNG